MTNQKYKILNKIHKALPTTPAKRSDFYKRTRKINQNKRIIDELVDANLLKESVGSDKLALTPKGIAELEKDKERREDIRRILIQFWISTAIALLSVFVSFIVLLIELGFFMPAPQ